MNALRSLQAVRLPHPLSISGDRLLKKSFQPLRSCRMASSVPTAVLSSPEPRPVTPASAPVAIVVGAGPGLGLAAAKRFAKEGFQVAIMARDEGRLKMAAEEIVAATNGRSVAIPCDCTDQSSVRTAFQAAHSLGNIQLLVYNTSPSFPWPPPKFTETPLAQFEAGLATACTGAFLCAQQVLDGMEERKSGTLIFTGATASLKGGAGFATFAPGKFALRALTQCLAREYGPKGIHVAHIIIDGLIKTDKVKQTMLDRSDDSFLDPEAIAESYWQLHLQHPSAWTHELDLRPFCENF